MDGSIKYVGNRETTQKKYLRGERDISFTDKTSGSRDLSHANDHCRNCNDELKY
jgi:hypothetical protein